MTAAEHATEARPMRGSASSVLLDMLASGVRQLDAWKFAQGRDRETSLHGVLVGLLANGWCNWNSAASWTRGSSEPRPSASNSLAGQRHRGQAVAADVRDGDDGVPAGRSERAGGEGEGDLA
eukprot:scaffold98188_cov58-Phaeocystis_antarctica.AAC.4